MKILGFRGLGYVTLESNMNNPDSHTISVESFAYNSGSAREVKICVCVWKWLIEFTMMPEDLLAGSKVVPSSSACRRGSPILLPGQWGANPSTGIVTIKDAALANIINTDPIEKWYLLDPEPIARWVRNGLLFSGFKLILRYFLI